MHAHLCAYAQLADEALYHAADGDGDGLLNHTEFLWFRHPVIGPGVRDRHANGDDDVLYIVPYLWPGFMCILLLFLLSTHTSTHHRAIRYHLSRCFTSPSAFLKRFDRDGDGKVGVEEFVSGALQIKTEGNDANSVQVCADVLAQLLLSCVCVCVCVCVVSISVCAI